VIREDVTREDALEGGDRVDAGKGDLDVTLLRIAEKWGGKSNQV